MQADLDKKEVNFQSYLAKMQHSLHPVDGICLVMYAQMTGINLGVVHGNGIWYNDPTAHHTSLVVYKGSF